MKVDEKSIDILRPIIDSAFTVVGSKAGITYNMLRLSCLVASQHLPDPTRNAHALQYWARAEGGLIRYCTNEGDLRFTKYSINHFNPHSDKFKDIWQDLIENIDTPLNYNSYARKHGNSKVFERVIEELKYIDYIKVVGRGRSKTIIQHEKCPPLAERFTYKDQT